jgi:single-strand DNA-binding protein
MSVGFFRLDIIGNVGKAELRTVGQDECLSFSVAVNLRKKKRGGATEEKTEWIQCAIWNDYARALAPYIAKGTNVFATGEPSFETYTDRDNNVRTQIKLRVDKVQLCGSSERQGSSGQHRESHASEYSGGSRQGYGAPRTQQRSAPQQAPAQANDAPPPEDFGYDGGDDQIPF